MRRTRGQIEQDAVDAAESWYEQHHDVIMSVERLRTARTAYFSAAEGSSMLDTPVATVERSRYSAALSRLGAVWRGREKGSVRW